MKKNGYTLAEVLVTLGVIGLIAAITGPLITKFTPDAEKIAYLKTYDMLSKTINEIARNQTFYPPIYKNENGLVNFANAPLLNLSEVKFGDITIDDNNKIAKLFGYYTGLKKLEEIKSISDEYQSEKYNKETPDFVTKDGAAIYMTTKISDFVDENGANIQDYQTEVYVDINGTDKGKNCLYDSTTCVKPDIFKFAITAAGEVIPADAMGNGYFKTRNSWKALKNNDIAEEPNFSDEDFQTNLSELILIEKEQEEGQNFIKLPWSTIEIKPVPPVPFVEEDDDTGAGGGGGGGGSDGDSNPCNLCTPPWTECRRGVCVNPYDYERDQTKTKTMQDMLDELDSIQNLRHDTGSSSALPY